MNTVTVVIPVFNEVKIVAELVKAVDGDRLPPDIVGSPW
jgi:hypothetical protein